MILMVLINLVKHKKTEDIYDSNGFDKYGKHKNTNNIYDPNGFNKYGKHKNTEDKYDPNGFDIKGFHKDTNTFFNKEKNVRKDILKNINWLKDKDEFLKLYDEIIKNGEFSVDTQNEPITSGMFKKFLEDILSGNIKANRVKNYEESIDNIEKILNNLIKSNNNDKLKNYIKKKIIYYMEKIKKRLKPIKLNLLKIKKEKDLSIYLLLYLKYILIIIQKN